jgi:uncharacterized RDD family membrane protein YckC
MFVTDIPGKKMPSRYASLSRRMWAATIDSILLLFFVAPLVDAGLNALLGATSDTIVTEILGQRLQHTPPGVEQLKMFWSVAQETGIAERFLISTMVQAIIISALTAWFWLKWSATPGKMLLKIKIVDAKTDGQISPRQVVIRLLGYVVSTLPLMLGFFWAWFNRRRQSWHDQMAGTVVIIKN